MILKHAIPAFALVSLIAFTGCDKKDQPTAASDSTNETQSALASVAAEVKQTAEAAAAGAKDTAAKVTTEVKQATQNTTAAVTSKMDAVKAEAQTLIDKAKGLVTDEKYEDALASLKQLSNLTLNAEQQKTVDNLKAQIQKLMASQVVTNATSALGNLLNK
jgi:hypothetical protein